MWDESTVIWRRPTALCEAAELPTGAAISVVIHEYVLFEMARFWQLSCHKSNELDLFWEQGN